MNHGNIEFFTATSLNWQPLLKEDKHKQIILDSLAFLVNDQRIWLYAYEIMPNHIHLLAKIMEKSPLPPVLIQNAKRFLIALTENIQKFEQNFGAIDDPQQGFPPINFGTPNTMA